MGGKRPDKYQNSPGHVPDEKDRHRNARGRGMIPPDVPNPEVERLRDLHAADAPEDDGELVVEVELEDSDQNP